LGNESSAVLILLTTLVLLSTLARLLVLLARLLLLSALLTALVALLILLAALVLVVVWHLRCSPAGIFPEQSNVSKGVTFRERREALAVAAFALIVRR
jgi:hypothetical protein